jgi:1-aminocyclopropane-1-carboxylate deaminase
MAIINAPYIQALPHFSENAAVDILRLDVVHPTVSGNKYYKLVGHIAQFRASRSTSIASMGGPYSNHLHALAFACHEEKIPLDVYVLSHQHTLTPTLQDLQDWGACIHFVNRANFQALRMHPQSYLDQAIYWVPEGGGGAAGLQGFDVLAPLLLEKPYDYWVVSVGTGTTLQALHHLAPHQNLLAIHTITGNMAFQASIEAACTTPANIQWYHAKQWGKFGQCTPEVMDFMQTFQQQYNIELDAVYTAKMLLQLQQHIANNHQDTPKSYLAIHTGGTQGNRSLNFAQ